MKAVGVVVTTIGLLVAAWLASSLVLEHLWGWFVAPVFAVPALTLRQAAGISSLIGFLRGYHKPAKEEGTLQELAIQWATQIVVWNGVTFGVGYLIHVWVM